MPASRITSKNPWHAVFVIDCSNSMAGQPSAILNIAIEEFLFELLTASMGQEPYFKVTVVSFGSHFHSLYEAVRETEINVELVTSFVGRSGGNNSAVALEEAARILKDNPGLESDYVPTVFFLSTGRSDDPEATLNAANELKNVTLPSGKLEIVTFGFGNADDELLQEVATDSEINRLLISKRQICEFIPLIGDIGNNAAGAESIEEAIMKL